MTQHHPGIYQVFPDKQELVSSNHAVDKLISKFRPARSAMPVHDMTLRRKQACPAALPCLPGYVGILDIKRIVQRIKPSDFCQLSKIDSARASACPKHRAGRWRGVLGYGVMPQPEETVLKSA